MNDNKTKKHIKILISLFISTLAMLSYIFSTRIDIKFPEYISIAMGFTPVDLLILCAITWMVYRYIDAGIVFNPYALIASLVFTAQSIYMRELFLQGSIHSIISLTPVFFAVWVIGFALIYYVFFAQIMRGKHKLNFELNSIIAAVFSIAMLLAYRYTHRNDISALIDYAKSLTLFELMIVYIAYHIYYSYICSRFKFRRLYLFAGFAFALTNIIYNDTFKHHAFFYTLKNEPLIFIVAIGIYTLSFYAAISYIMDYLHSNLEGISKAKNPFAMAAWILLLWTPIYLIFFPGAVSWESSWTINYVLGIGVPREFAPTFYQLFISLFVHIGHLLNNDTLGVVIYFAFVGYISALAMAMIINRAAKLNLGSGIMQFISIFCIANPFVILKTFTMQYDSLLGIALLYLSILLYDIMLEGKDFVNRKNFLLLYVSGFAVCAFRNVGKILVVVAAISLGIYGFKKLGKKALLSSLSLILAIITFVYGNAALKKSMGYAPDDKLANFGMPLQQMSFVITKRGVEALTDEEYEKLSSFVDPDIFRFFSNPDKIDNIKYQMESYWEYRELSMENYTKLKSVWLSMMRRYPIDYIKAFVNSSYLYFIPGHFDNFNIFGHYNHQIYHSRDSHSNMQHTLYYMGIEKARIHAKNSALLGFTTPFGLYMSAGFIQLLHLFILGFAIQRRMPKFVLLPTILYALGAVFAPVNGWIRYMTPAGFVTPLFILFVLYAIKTDKSRGSITLQLE